MKKHEARALLTGGERGIEEWNRRRAAGDEVPRLGGWWLFGRLDLRGRDLRCVDLVLLCQLHVREQIS